MSDGTARPVIRYDGVEYTPISELTEREKFEAERITGRPLTSLEDTYTGGLLIAYFTLRRAGVAFTWDEFLDSAAFEFGEAAVPLDGSTAGPSSDGSLTGTGGTPPGPPSSESTPG